MAKCMLHSSLLWTGTIKDIRDGITMIQKVDGMGMEQFSYVQPFSTVINVTHGCMMSTIPLTFYLACLGPVAMQQGDESQASQPHFQGLRGGQD